MTINVLDATGATVTILTPNELSAAIVAAIGGATYFPATQPVSGTVALDAPSLAALETIELGTASLAALESVTAIGPVTDAQIRATPLPVALDAASLAALENTTVIVTGGATLAKQDETIAAINGLIGTEYETVAASATDQIMGATGAIGDLLVSVLIVPSSTSPGAVTVKDGAAGPAITIFAGGATSIATLHPVSVPLNLKSTGAGWRVTTGAGLTAIATGNFT